ncbi:UDP-glucuronosyltransferase 2B30-like [Pseudomyrmex gracilis]|uniref:UDP-glucuronosyltransferase 2B30-like n=1 Tax=Pseudomyrmex gracilis TaxID=219809 RepID=UPI000994C613|nr:UDP-glucuronosyltransferase 2B30-like [Pseudomyrmex gracilis]
MLLPLICLYVYSWTFQFVSSSSLVAPPLSALIVAFENIYDLSLLANTLSDEGIDTSLIIPNYAAQNIYNNLIDVEVLQLNVNTGSSTYAEKRALQACDSLLKDEKILKKLQEIQPTITIFPALRHDGCLLPFVRHIDSIPVIWIQNSDEELYAFESTGVALSVNNGSFFSRLATTFAARSVYSNAKNNYLSPALRLVCKYLTCDANVEFDRLYSDVRLVLWGADTVLRSNFASLTEMLVQIGCHHCRGPQPLPADLQKPLIEHRMGTVIALLDESYETLIRELAKKLPQDRQGLAVVWKVNRDNAHIPANLYIRKNIDRQDLIGYSRTRVVLSHCDDTELLENAFHRTPVICFPRNEHESRNAARAVELGFARSSTDQATAEEIASYVQTMHENVAYSESARKISLAIRDRLTPASDRLVYWLRYVARTKDDSEKFHQPKSQSRTLTEDLQFFVGLLVGIFFGLMCAGCAVIAYLMRATKAQRSKGRYAR